MNFQWSKALRFFFAVVAATLATMVVDAIMQAIFFGDSVAVMGMMVFLVWGLPVIGVIAFPLIWWLWYRISNDIWTWSISLTGLGFLAALAVATTRILFDVGYADQVATAIGGGVTGLLLNSGIILLIALPDCFTFGVVSWLVLSRTEPKKPPR